MYLASFIHEGRECVGARLGTDHLIDLRDAAKRAGYSWPYRTMLDVVSGGAQAKDAARALLEAATADSAYEPSRPRTSCGAATPPAREGVRGGAEQLRVRRAPNRRAKPSDVLPQARHQPRGAPAAHRCPAPVPRLSPGA